MNDTSDYLCNGDTMFHVNKGIIGFKMDGARKVSLSRTSVANLENLGGLGSSDCGDYEFSHPGATLPGYGGAAVRAYSFAGSRKVSVDDCEVYDLRSVVGSVSGFDVMTDSKNVVIDDCRIDGIEAGISFVANGGPNEPPDAIGFHVGAGTRKVEIDDYSMSGGDAFDEIRVVEDDSGRAKF